MARGMAGWTYSAPPPPAGHGLDLAGRVVTGKPEIEWYGAAVWHWTRKGARLWCESVGETIAADVRASMSQAYPPASTPGTPPAVRTGQLKASIGYQVVEFPLSCEVRIGTMKGTIGDIYGRIHELGGIITNGFGKGIRIVMPARPFLRPALYRNVGMLGRKLKGIFGMLFGTS